MSEVKVNKISPRTNCGTVTLGDSGDTFSIPAGVTLTNSGTATGFGPTGAVSWDTTKKTTGFTAVSGNGYFCDTTSAAFTVTLPATPAAGDIVAIADYANTSATNNITVGRNGSKIDGETENAKIKTNGQVYTLVYVDSTEGWKTVGQTFNQISTAAFIVATGGTVTCCGDYKIHTFTGPGTFTVCSVGNPGGSTTVDYLVVAGGGGGGRCGGAGGGAGGYRQNYPSPATAGLPVTATSYPITVGSGGAGKSGDGKGAEGNNSVFSTITSAGGGGGSGRTGPTNQNAGSGGSGGGGQYDYPGSQGSGNTPPVSPPQGNNGGNGGGFANPAGGGGGASGVGGNSGPGGGIGGTGSPNAITGTALSYAGGGGGGGPAGPSAGSPCGTGGRGSPNLASGTTNRGGGGGGCVGATAPAAGNGGSGVVIIRYKYK